MSNGNSTLDKWKPYSYAPVVMTQVALFPVSKPNVPYIERTNGNITVTIAPTKYG